MNYPSLKIDNLCANYGTQSVLKDLSLEIKNEPALVITGPSGCGKSTLLKICSGSMDATQGNVTVCSSATKPHVAYVPQSGALMPWKRVYDQLALPLKLLKQKPLEQKIEQKIYSMLDELELLGTQRRFPHELSGGQQQRLALGQALIADPDVLFLDEPFSACDTMLKEKLQDFLKKLLQKRSCLLIAVTHDLSEAVFLSHKILILGTAGSGKYLLCDNSSYKAVSDANVRENADFGLEVSRLHRNLRMMQGDLDV